MKVMSVAELLDESAKNQAKLNERVQRDGDYVVLDGHYSIPLEKCKTHRELVAWIAQLFSKAWITPPMIGRLIEITVGREPVL